MPACAYRRANPTSSVGTVRAGSSSLFIRDVSEVYETMPIRMKSRVSGDAVPKTAANASQHQAAA